mgnify:CR=1 FL=1
MDINYDLTTIYIKPQFEDNTFIHFDSSSHLNQFIKYNNKIKIYIYTRKSPVQAWA